jgi:integrase
MRKTVSNTDSFIHASSKRPPNRRKITDVLVRKVRPEAKAFMIWDTCLPRGFALKVCPTSTRSYKFVYAYRGEARWYHIEDTRKVKLKDARRFAAELALRVMRGEDPLTADKRAPRGDTFEEAHKRYLTEHTMKHNKSWQQGKALVERYVLPRLGKIPVKDITRADVKAVFGGIEKPALANQVKAALSATLSWAVDQDLVTTNVCKGIKRNPTRSRERRLSDAEVPVIWAALDRMGTPEARACQTILVTGARPGEVSHMLHEHLDGNWWLQPGEKTRDWPGTKNKQDHACPLTRPARAIIDGQRQGNVVLVTGHVFTDAGKPVKNLPGVMRRVCAQLGIRDAIRPHDLRRSFLSTVTELGFDRHIMNVIANHITKETTDVYDRASYKNRIKEAAEAAANHIMALARGQVSGVVELHRGSVQKNL